MSLPSVDATLIFTVPERTPISPLPGSPSLVLPDRSGAPANLLASLLLLGAAVGLAAPPRWRAWPAAAALAALVAPLVLGAAEATFDVAALAALPGRDLGGARICAALAMLVAVPSLVPTAQDGPSATAWALVIAATAVVAAGLALPAPTAGLPAALTAGIVLAAVGVYALLVARLGRRVPAPAAALVTVALGALSVALSIVAEVG